MKNKKRYFFYLCILFFLVLNVEFLKAQDGTFTASADPSSIAAGEQFQLSFTFSGTDVNSVKNLKAPDFRQFVVISGPNQSTSMQWINGRMSGSVTYSYALYARQAGKYSIGPASIDYKGKILQSNSVQIEVTQGKSKQQQKQQDQPGVDIGDNLLIKAYSDKQRVRMGEQLVVTFKLYTRVSVSGYDLAKAPTFEGFWGEDFDMPKPPVQTNETLNGKQYRCVVIKKTALFATQSGTLKIAPLEVRCAVQVQAKRRSNDPFDQFFNDPFFQQMQTTNLEVKSNPLVITVDPLPANAPSGYSGAIGRFTFDVSADKKKVKAGDPITLRVSVSGSGNIKLVTLPKPQLPADIEAYEPEISENISRDGGIIRGKKTAEYLLIPRNAGQRVLEPLTFVHFNLDKREYVTLHSPKFEFTIEPGKEFTGSTAGTISKEDVRILGEDIRFLKLASGSFRHSSEEESDWLFVLCMALPPAVFAGAWFYRKRMEKIYGDMPKLLFETAGREASRRLKKAHLLLEQGNTESYHAEILKALTEYLEHKLRIAKAVFVMDDATAKLRQHGVKEEVIRSLKSCMERAEFARFAPGSDTAETRKELLDIAAGAINGIESTFSRRGIS
ncbi:MAG: protein BatD [Bacteroidetes bacterium]|nr:protein BatD [Bacteroidota bacterium]